MLTNLVRQVWDTLLSCAIPNWKPHSQDMTHRRRPASESPSHSPPSSPLPTQTYHPASILVPTPALVESVAGAAHYSGINVDPESIKRRRGSTERRSSHSLDVHSEHQRVLDDLRELYCCRPTPQIFDRTWNKDALLEGPLAYCQGYDEYAAQWYALKNFCSSSETRTSRVLSSSSIPNRIIYSQTQVYILRWVKFRKTVTSIIIVDLDDDDKIMRLVDQWDGKDLPTKFGAYYLRRISARLGTWFFKAPTRYS